MGDLFSLFWEVDPPPIPLSFTIPNQDYECRKDDSCGAIGSFLLWYFIIILVLLFFSRASVWMSEKKKDEDSGTSTSVSKASKDTSYKRQSKDGDWDSLQMMKKTKQNQLTPVTDSEVALVNAYLEQRRARRHSQFSQVNQIQHDSDTTECDSEESNSGASSWKESESEHHPSPASIKKRKLAQRQRNVGSYQIRERPCLHCKAMRTNEWLTRHFLQNASATNHMKADIQEENCVPEINTKFSKF
ncbi:serine-rich single-pass membrane protein 1 [Lycaon pictus]|uniref:Serine rich single-pass membrane protein 1 n=3 Tax=Canis lupus TaxID=9612 RepID=A0A8I3NX18_CANLF|nr:serine-rich single-pass membrane protein 1 isoform X2 [Canis lupus dingo]XP_038542073.1 serine-rich single-pass membrane protein 1 isoform X2 [Canis lupus familiaris]XP_850606.1 serine-rich single-pass membrane protein 1 isoform X2 [Canis lupus familiaris]|eukprot:XP_850606.1 serine-rich single-pass membrane protein 1 isoform X2 [Canis lupus familiaris]